MNTIDIIAIGIFVIIVLGGYATGFGKSLKMLTDGAVGFIISVFACVAFGGTLQNLPFAENFITSVNNAATEFLSVLEIIQPGYIAFYVLLFFSVQLLRIIIVKMVASIDNIENPVIKLVNKLMGAALCFTFFGGIVLLLMAGLNLIEGTDFAAGLLEKMDDSYLMFVYDNNPISFT